MLERQISKTREAVPDPVDAAWLGAVAPWWCYPCPDPDVRFSHAGIGGSKSTSREDGKRNTQNR